MIKYVFIFFVINIFSISGLLAQNKVEKISHVFVSKKEFSKHYSVKDSSGYIIKNNDTLIGIKNYQRPKGVAVPYEAKDSLFLDLYKKVAFRPKEKGKETHPMKYWKGDINIYFSKSVNRKVKKEFLKFIKEIDNEIDSLKISYTSYLKNANYVIYHSTDYEYEEKLKNTASAGYYIYWNRKNQINKGFLKVNKENLFSDNLEIQQLKQRFIESLGWFNTTNEFDCTSYFRDCSTDLKNLTDLDIELLKYHYSYGICKGTTRSVFEDQHKKAKEIIEIIGDRFMFYHIE